MDPAPTMSAPVSPHANQGETYDRLAHSALPSYGRDGQPVRLLSLSENATYLVGSEEDAAVLRVHRLGYHTRESILSELAWSTALREEAGIRTPRVLPTTVGDSVLALPDGPVDRYCVLFERLPGVEPPEDRLAESFTRLGEITTRMHRHARGWARPPGFIRFRWDHDTTLGSAPRWGHWRAAPAVGAAETELLHRADRTIAARLVHYGDGAERFGLVHADLRLANLLVHDGDVSVIDFDDCGFSWWMYDFAAAISFLEHTPRVPELQEAWLQGYRQVLPVSPEDEAILPTLIMLRRLLLLAWVGSHADTDLARLQGPEFTAGTCQLAERYLSRHA
jgi:Ser/Thr protein kinase RdoA (MazF antagonist)